jgi:hypothetical protein
MPRFTLLTLLLFTTIVAGAISHLLTSRELARVKRALALVRKDLNYIDSASANDICAVALPTYGPMQWRWRIQLPTTGTYRLRSSVGMIPETGLPAESEIHSDIFLDHNGRPLPRGESILLSVAIFADENKTWRIVTETPERNLNLPIANAPPWLAASHKMLWISKIYGKSETVSCNATEPLYLLQNRKAISAPGGGFTADANPTDGILIWVEQVEDSAKP